MTDAAAADRAAERARLVDEVDALYRSHPAGSGISAMSPRVRAAMLKVERHRLVPAEQQALAYRDRPLPIGQGQTISQPYIVAMSTELVLPDPAHVVLEIGTGSGFQAAILAEIVSKVYTIEILESLSLAAQKNLASYANIEFKVGDGYRGWPEKGPFDAIVVTAAAPSIPEALVAQLKPGGRMVIPVGEPGGLQELMLVEKSPDGATRSRSVMPVRFVPLVPSR